MAIIYAHRQIICEALIEEAKLPPVGKRISLLEPIAGRRTFQRVLIARDKVSQQLAKSGYFYRIIEARELLENRGES
jgi:hypothetical protein